MRRRCKRQSSTSIRNRSPVKDSSNNSHRPLVASSHRRKPNTPHTRSASADETPEREHIGRNEPRSDPGGGKLQLAVAHKTANLVLEATEFVGGARTVIGDSRRKLEPPAA